MGMDLLKARDCLANFNFSELFTAELGWSQPELAEPVRIVVSDTPLTQKKIALLGDVAVFEVVSEKGNIPDGSVRAAVHKEISLLFRDNLVIFIDDRRIQSLWYWVKHQDGKLFIRNHFYFRGQPGDLFLSKLNSMVFEVGEFDKFTDAPVVEVTKRLKDALDVERVTKKFYKEFQELHLGFLDLIEGIDDERECRWYASVMLNRLMFIYFLQRKFFIDNGDNRYLQNKLAQIKEMGKNLYYEKFLKLLFFEGFAKPEQKRSQEAKELLGKIKYLNGGLFLLHPIEIKNPGITIKDKAFEKLFSLFERYSWNLNDTPGGEDNEINPDVLGYIFEKYINQKAFGAYYTRPEITEYLCERTIYNLVLGRVNHQEIPGVLAGRQFDDLAELLINLDAGICWELIDRVLPQIRILDPACGSGAFLVSAMKTLINIYAAVIGKIKFLSDKRLESWLKAIEKKHPRIDYYIKKTIITENLFGVDIMEEAVEIGKLRLFLALVAAVNSVDDLEPLPNIDFNILTGNSLVGLMHVDDKKFEGHLQGNLFRKSYRQVVDEKNRLVTTYRKASAYSEDLQSLREDIDVRRDEAIATLNSILCDDFKYLDIKFEQAVWDDKKKKSGKPVKRAISEEDINKLKPFHWGFEFNEIINTHAGFDVIITNPPWEIFKPNAKEFFEEYSHLVTKKKMTIKDFEKEQAKLLKDPEIRGAWLEYLGGYPYMSAFFRSSPQYKNQISVVNGKKAGTDINLYKLFLEQCFNLLREGGYCGIVIPSGIYTDLGTKQLREMLF
ncbi:MAG: ATP-binding protein, partial [Candidatus Aminicenantes bacterium]|nr:ATP-binding protein [Candidatus Aminicenantes bacterium]